MKRYFVAASTFFSLIILTAFQAVPIEDAGHIPVEHSTQNTLENDIKYCLAKAIGIDNQVKIDQRYSPQKNLNIREDAQSSRYRTLVKRVAGKTNQFNISRLPASISIKFEKENFEGDDNDHLKNMNDVEWEIVCSANRKYTVKMHYFIYGSLDPNGQIESSFDLINNTYNATLSVGQVDSESDGYYETKIKIRNDIVVSYSKKKAQ